MMNPLFSKPGLSWGLGGALALLLGLAPLAGRAQTVRLEAEAATLKGPSVTTTIPGYSGTGYVADFSTTTDSLLFSYNVPAASRYDLRVGYTAPSGTRTTMLLVDGSGTNLSLPGSGQAFSTVAGGRFNFTAGTHRVAFAANQGYYGIDYIELTPVATVLTPLVNGRAEAEQGVLNNVTVATSPAGYSGTGYVTGFTNSSANNVNLTLDIASTGLYQLTLGYTSPYGLKGYNITVNGTQNSGFFQGTTAASPFASVGAGNYLLYKGLNTIELGGNYGYYGVDYVQLAPVTVQPPVKPARQLSDAQATPATQNLYSYLYDQYGVKTLAGQQDDQIGNGNSEVAYVLATTGKEPAIASMDLYDYSTAPVAAYGTPSGTTERYLNWAQRGNGRGIASLIWHWRSPADIIAKMNNGQSDPSGAFYTKNTNFNLAAALADPNGTRYQLLLQDIDLIAAQLQKFQAAGVPVLWRPLHESPGNFFWWNAQGPDAFKKLWVLLHDRLVTYHGLHNLIWVYSTTETPSLDWYPGDAYVDVAGEDVYASLTANISNNWADMQAQFGGRKVVALTETGNPPDPDNIRAYGTRWTWFCSWQGTYVRGQQPSYLKRVYNDADIITRDELPDWYHYQSALASLPGRAAGASLRAYPNPSAGPSLTLALTLPAATEATVELLNALGQRVATQSLRLAAGDSQVLLPTAGLAPGLYQLVLRRPGQLVLGQRLVLQ